MDLSIKTSIGILITVFTSLPSFAAEVFHSPSLCEPEKQVLVMQNLTRTPQRAWTQVRLEGYVDEIQWDVKPQEKLEIKSSEFLSEMKYFSVKPLNNQAFRFTVKCTEGLTWTLTSSTSPQVSHYVPSQARSFKIYLQNLFLQSQKVTLRAFDKAQNVVAEKEITIEKSYDTESLKWNLSSDVSRIDVVGTERLHSDVFYIQNNQEIQSPGLSQVAKLSPSSDKVYFLVSTKSAAADEAFVIALDEPSKIATAREQIQNPLLEKIIVAGIELGNGGFNRAFKARDKAPYSWSVSRVDAFADFAHIDCDGSPDLTEERLEQKLSEGGRICFWRYRVIRELSPEEVRSGKLK
ncbi:hypothetical protein [Bdellovibrio sp. HCB2-146]|uniref:BP74-related protein n=1 Tax=Bdellovibrio sp. HCB2-146 TaxID=3394362 RepID=UPI0039BD8434